MSHRHPLLRSLAIYREMPWRFALVAGLFVFINLGLVWQQWLIGHALNDVTAGVAVRRLDDGSLDSHLAWGWFCAILAVALGRAVLQYAASLGALILGQELLTRLRERILEQVLRLHLGYHWQHGIGEIVTRTTRDADKVRDALVSFWRQLVETPLVVLATVGLLGWYHPLLAVGPLLLTLLGLYIFVLQTERLVELDRAVGAAYDRVNQDLAEGIGAVRDQVVRPATAAHRRFYRTGAAVHRAGPPGAGLGQFAYPAAAGAGGAGARVDPGDRRATGRRRQDRHR